MYLSHAIEFQHGYNSELGIAQLITTGSWTSHVTKRSVTVTYGPVQVLSQNENVTNIKTGGPRVTRVLIYDVSSLQHPRGLTSLVACSKIICRMQGMHRIRSNTPY